MAEGTIELITRTECNYCDNAKMLLKNENKNWKELLIGEDISRDDVLEQYPDQKVLPIVIVDNELIGGYNSLLDYLYPPLTRTENDG